MILVMIMINVIWKIMKMILMKWLSNDSNNDNNEK